MNGCFALSRVIILMLAPPAEKRPYESLAQKQKRLCARRSFLLSARSVNNLILDTPLHI